MVGTSAERMKSIPNQFGWQRHRRVASQVWYGKMDRATEGNKCDMASQGISGKRTLYIELREGAAFEFSQQEYGLKINGSVL